MAKTQKNTRRGKQTRRNKKGGFFTRPFYSPIKSKKMFPSIPSIRKCYYDGFSLPNKITFDEAKELEKKYVECCPDNRKDTPYCKKIRTLTSSASRDKILEVLPKEITYDQAVKLQGKYLNYCPVGKKDQPHCKEMERLINNAMEVNRYGVAGLTEEEKQNFERDYFSESDLPPEFKRNQPYKKPWWKFWGGKTKKHRRNRK